MIDPGKAIWYKIIHAGIESGYSAYRTLTTARRLGLKIRTETFYRMWREVLKQKDAMKFIETYPEDKPIPWYRHPRTEYNFPSKYGYVVKVIDYELGVTRTFGIYTNRTMSKMDIYNEAIDIALRNYVRTVSELHLINLWRR